MITKWALEELCNKDYECRITDEQEGKKQEHEFAVQEYWAQFIVIMDEADRLYEIERKYNDLIEQLKEH